jgi:hypothetical protein
MTAKIPFLPEQNSYGAVYSQDAIGVKLAGGGMRLRADQIGACSEISASWLLDPADETDFQSFWQFSTNRGTLPFLADLILDGPWPMQYMVRMVPGTYKVNQVKGLSLRVSMDLEVEPNEFTIATVSFSSAGQSITIITAPATAPDMQVLLDPGDLVQVAGASINNGVNKPLNFDAIYTVSTTPTPTVAVLNLPASVNSSWDATGLPLYPAGLSGNIARVYLMKVPA